jgi:hypothetical protein
LWSFRRMKWNEISASVSKPKQIGYIHQRNRGKYRFQCWQVLVAAKAWCWKTSGDIKSEIKKRASAALRCQLNQQIPPWFHFDISDGFRKLGWCVLKIITSLEPEETYLVKQTSTIEEIKHLLKARNASERFHENREGLCRMVKRLWKVMFKKESCQRQKENYQISSWFRSFSLLRRKQSHMVLQGKSHWTQWVHFWFILRRKCLNAKQSSDSHTSPIHLSSRVTGCCFKESSSSLKTELINLCHEMLNTLLLSEAKQNHHS